MSVVENAGVDRNDPYFGQVKSIISNINIDCNQGRWGLGGITYASEKFGTGVKISEKKLENSNVKWEPISNYRWARRLQSKYCQATPVALAPVAATPTAAPAPAVPIAPIPTSDPATPNNFTRLSNISYLFRDSVKKSGEDYRIMYIVDNAGIGPGKPLSDQVKSQVYQTVINCKNNTWAYDQLYWYDQLFGKGSRLSEQKWQPSQLAWNTIAAGHPIERAYQIACPVASAAAPAPAAIPIN